MTVLLATTVLPVARTAGGEICTGAFVDALRRAGHRVVVVGYRRAGDSLDGQGPDDVVPATRPIETDNAGARPVAWMAAALLRNEPYSVAKYRSRRLRSRLAQLVDQERPDVVVLDHAQMVWTLPRDGFGVPLVHIAHNVEHEMYRQAHEHGEGLRAALHRREARLMEAAERRLVRAADAVWTLSSEDAAAFAALGAAAPPRRFALPPSSVVGADATASEVSEPAYDVAMIGSWTWGPNAAGLRWFVDHVHPMLPADLRVVVAGGGADQIAASLERRGRVPDADAFLRAARVVACPSIQGGGVQLKTLDAIATGRPVVATSVALRGLPDSPPTVRRADEPADFAAALVAAVEDGDPGEAAAEARRWIAARRDAFDAAVADAIAEVIAR